MQGDALILRYVRRARVRAALGSGIPTAFALAVVAVAAYLVALLVVPGVRGTLAVGLGVTVTVGALWAMWRERVRIVDLDARAGCAEGLTTWWLQRRQRDGSAMRAWLAREVAARLQRLPVARAVGPSVRRALRRLAYLLPLLLALLLLRIVWPFGLRTGDRMGVEAPAPQQGEGDPASAGGTGDARDREQKPDRDAGSPRDPPQQDPPAGAPPPRDESANGDGAAIPSRPLHLPVREEFVVPNFLGEGPTTTGQGREVIEEVAPSSTGSAAGAGGPPSPEPPEVTFQRALERALRARHVPPAERPMVERYFRALAAGGK